jgi:hypothetical protein
LGTPAQNSQDSCSPLPLSIAIRAMVSFGWTCGCGPTHQLTTRLQPATDHRSSSHSRFQEGNFSIRLTRRGPRAARARLTRHYQISIAAPTCRRPIKWRRHVDVLCARDFGQNPNQFQTFAGDYQRPM